MTNKPTTNYQLPTNVLSPLVVIVGPTASGKSSLALEIARKFHGELICADSRTIYKDMDIGTAKPSLYDQQEVPHHMVDIVTPDQPYSAAQFKKNALIWIDDIHIRGKLPILVGGTGLYIDSIIFDYAFLPPGSQQEREQLESLTVEQLQQKLHELKIPLPENAKNKRHLIRKIETNGAVPVKKDLRKNTLVIGIDRSKEELLRAIHARTVSMINSGLKAEVDSLVQKYGWDSPGMQSVGYKEWREGDSGERIAMLIEKNTVQYAKRQRTWFKRNQHISWVQNVNEAEQLINTFLQS